MKNHWKKQKEWDEENLKTVSTRLKNQDYENFREICEESGGTMHSVLRLAIATMLQAKKVPMSESLERDIGKYSISRPKPPQKTKNKQK